MTPESDWLDRPITRRAALLGTGALVLAACSSDSPDAPADAASADPTATAEPDAPTSPAEPTAAATVEPTAAPQDEDAQADASETAGIADLATADFAALAVCAMLPETTAGPFPTEEQLVRRDVTEGYPGHPLRLGLRVVDGSCEPMPDAAVEIWHTDATGDYSSYEDNGSGKDEGPGTTFMRGNQVAGDDGIVEFASIYPGWYEGRAVHIHVRVWVDGEIALTSQLYFDDDYTANVFGTGAYVEFGPPDTTNASDRLTGDVESDGSLLTLTAGPTRNGDGTIALANLGIG